MNLNYYFICIIFKFSLIHCLKINELKIDTFFNSPPPIPSKNKDFLDVDVRSDVLPITAEIYDAPTEPSNNKEKFKFYGKNGKIYRCWINSKSEKSESSSGQNEELLKQIVLNRKKSCYYFKGNIWIYEYCHLKSTRQVSRTKLNDNHEEFALGRFYPPRRSLNFDRSLNLLSTEFFDGTYCDLTGLPRTSYIKYICANNKQAMHVTNVMETSACVYYFLVHVPELCDYLPNHARLKKRISKLNCINFVSERSKSDNTKPLSKNEAKIDQLDKILRLIETKYKDSQILKQYKGLLLKATEKLKSQQLAKDFSKKDFDVSFLELFNKLSKNESESKEDDDDKKINDMEF